MKTAWTTLLSLTLTLGAVAQERNSSDFVKTTRPGSSKSYAGLWTYSPGGIQNGIITVKLSTISSVSIHNYMLNGKIPIRELYIDTTGNAAIRIYTLIGAKDLGSNITDAIGRVQSGAQDRTGAPAVAKQFPQSTHSHCIEYSVSTVTQLDQVYQSVMKAWVTNQGTMYNQQGQSESKED